MGKPLKIERIGDMFRLLWLESVITEASLMTRNIKFHSMLMNWMCFPLQVWGALSPQPKARGAGGLCPPSQNRNTLVFFETEKRKTKKAESVKSRIS